MSKVQRSDVVAVGDAGILV